MSSKIKIDIHPCVGEHKHTVDISAEMWYSMPMDGGIAWPVVEPWPYSGKWGKPGRYVTEDVQEAMIFAAHWLLRVVNSDLKIQDVRALAVKDS